MISDHDDVFFDDDRHRHRGRGVRRDRTTVRPTGVPVSRARSSRSVPVAVPVYQQPVGAGLHCQLRLGGHLTLTSNHRHADRQTDRQTEQ